MAPLDVARLAALVMGAGALCAALGLAASATSRRPGAALGLAYGYVFVWVFGSLAALPLSMGASLAPGPAWAGVSKILADIGQTNPFYAIDGLAGPSGGSGLDQNWIFCLKFDLAGILALILFAMAFLRRPLPAPAWVGPGPTRNGGRKGRRPGGYMETPWANWLRFRNPVLRRELKAMCRVRRPSTGPLVVIAALIPGCLTAYGFLVHLAWTNSDSQVPIWMLTWIVMVIVAVICPAIKGAQCFASEVERGTWEGLQLSQLSPADVVWGKVLGPALIYVPFLVVAAPLLIPGAVDSVPMDRGVQAALSPFCAVLGSGWFYALLGARISLIHRRSAVATGWTIAAVLAMLVFPPMLLWLIPNREFSDLPNLGANLVNPFVVLVTGLNAAEGDPHPFLETGLPFLAINLFLGAVLFAGAVQSVKQKMLPARGRENPAGPK